MAKTSTSNRRKSGRTARFWIVLGSSVLMILVGIFVIRTQGCVEGTEFSPSDFQHRTFKFYEIPLLHLQITPIKRNNRLNETARYLRQNSLIRTPVGSPKVWHLAQLSNNLTGARNGSPMLLLDQLNLTSGGEIFWRKWSKDHPEHANKLWPIVQKLAQRELYVLVPELLELSAIQRTVQEFDAEVDRHLIDQYEGLIDDMVAANRSGIASELLAEAKHDFPNDPCWDRFDLPDVPLPDPLLDKTPTTESTADSKPAS